MACQSWQISLEEMQKCSGLCRRSSRLLEALTSSSTGMSTLFVHTLHTALRVKYLLYQIVRLKTTVVSSEQHLETTFGLLLGCNNSFLFTTPMCE